MPFSRLISCLADAWYTYQGKVLDSILCGQMELIDATQILHAVKAMLQRYGDNAPEQAAIRAKELADRGDAEGAEIWQQVEVELIARLTEKRDRPNSRH